MIISPFFYQLRNVTASPLKTRDPIFSHCLSIYPKIISLLSFLGDFVAEK